MRAHLLGAALAAVAAGAGTHASDEASGRSQSITITADKAGKLSRRDVERMIADAEAHASDDAAALDKARARNDLEGACYSARSTLSKHASEVVGSTT